MYKEKAASKSKTEVILVAEAHWYLPTRERNLLALPTLDMYLPLSKLESIH